MRGTADRQTGRRSKTYTRQLRTNIRIQTAALTYEESHIISRVAFEDEGQPRWAVGELRFGRLRLRDLTGFDVLRRFESARLFYFEQTDGRPKTAAGGRRARGFISESDGKRET